jgi:hypothetical protein
MRPFLVLEPSGEVRADVLRRVGRERLGEPPAREVRVHELEDRGQADLGAELAGLGSVIHVRMTSIASGSGEAESGTRSRPARGRQVDNPLCDELPKPLKRRAPGADTTLVRAPPVLGRKTCL